MPEDIYSRRRRTPSSNVPIVADPESRARLHLNPTPCTLTTGRVPRGRSTTTGVLKTSATLLVMHHDVDQLRAPPAALKLSAARQTTTLEHFRQACHCG